VLEHSFVTAQNIQSLSLSYNRVTTVFTSANRHCFIFRIWVSFKKC